MHLNMERVLRFVVVAEQLSFTRAATLLRIDQPWLSRQIMQLEHEIGVVLFDRIGSRIFLTAEGKEFLEYAKEVEATADRARRKMEDMKRRALSSVRIAVCSASHSVDGRQNLMARFATGRPKVGVEYFAYAHSDEVVEMVQSGEVDFGIAFGPITAPHLEAHVIDQIEATLAIPAEDALATAPAVTLADLKGRRITVGLRDKTSPRYARAYDWIDKVGAIPVFVPEGQRFVFEVASAQRLLAPCYTAADKAPAGFVQRTLDGPHPKFDVCLIRNKRPSSSPGEYLWRLSHEMQARLEAGQSLTASEKSDAAPAKRAKRQTLRAVPTV
jgi:DNA-binding transcriptional LysR family regulator